MKNIYRLILFFIILAMCLLLMGAECEPITETSTTKTTLFKGKINIVTNGHIYTQCYDNVKKILYIGGDFTKIGVKTGCGIPINLTDGKPSISLKNLPKVEGDIFAVIPDGVGGWYIGGEFTKVGSLTRNNIAHIDSKGEPTNWNPNANSPVHTLAISGSTIYAGGYFTNIGGQPRNRIAAIDATTGNATTWNLIPN